MSVLVPSYNCELFLPAALESIAGQTWKDYEVIVADDGSRDASLEIARSWERRDSRFRLSAGRTNVGMTRNWNRALSEARGRYVVKLDGDDAMQSQCLELLVKALEETPGSVAGFCRTQSADEALTVSGPYLGDRAFANAGLDPATQHVLSGDEWYQLCFDDIQLWHSNAQIHRRDDLLQMGAWDATWGCASDTDLILRVLERRRPVIHIPYQGIIYRGRVASVSDEFRKQGWLLWEGTLIALLSLQRYHRAGDGITSRLRRAWHRYWSNLQQLQKDGSIDRIPEGIRLSLGSALDRVERPPMSVLLRGRSHRLMWRLKQLATTDAVVR